MLRKVASANNTIPKIKDNIESPISLRKQKRIDIKIIRKELTKESAINSIKLSL